MERWLCDFNANKQCILQTRIRNGAYTIMYYGEG